METSYLSPEVWEIIRKLPKVQLTEKQSVYLKEVYDLPDEISKKFNENNCIAIDKQNRVYKFNGNIDSFIEMLIFDIKNN